jgi:ABC-2 type transport system permease protein
VKAWVAYWSILSKDIRSYYLKPPNISWGIIFPLAWTLMFFIKSDSAVDVRTLLPGVIALSILFGTTSMLAVTVTFEKKGRSFERLLLAPISFELLMLAKTSGAVLFGVGNACVPVMMAWFLTDLTGVIWWQVCSAVVLIAVSSAFLGLFVAVSVREVFEAQTFSNFFRFPMLFLCGLFFPIAKLPGLLQPLAFAMPLTYGADLLHGAVNNNARLPAALSCATLAAFCLLLFLISLRNIRSKWIL